MMQQTYMHTMFLRDLAYLQREFCGAYYADNPEENDWHTWLEVDGVIIDLTADQFQENKDIYVGPYDLFHDRYEQERLKYKGFYDLAEGCWERMLGLYNQIVANF